MLICPVRGCRLELVREERRVVCARNHSFDIARSGYINLLQVQERRAKDPGDSEEAMAARRRLHDRGVTARHQAAIAEAISATPGDVVLDAGCGDGFYLGTMQQQSGLAGHGVDISVPSVDAAAKRYPSCEWIVANADRGLPYSDKSFSAVLSITGRMNAPEFRRVLRDDGRMLVAVAAPDDLIELRKSGKDRVPQASQTFAKEFELVGQRRVTASADLDADTVRDVLISIYRPMQAQPVDAMRVTFSLDLLMFKPL